MTIMQPDDSRPYGWRLVDVPTLTDAEVNTIRTLAAQHDGEQSAVLLKVLQVVRPPRAVARN